GHAQRVVDDRVAGQNGANVDDVQYRIGTRWSGTREHQKKRGGTRRSQPPATAHAHSAYRYQRSSLRAPAGRLANAGRFDPEGPLGAEAYSSRGKIVPQRSEAVFS